MNAFNIALRREFCVAFSRRAQPVWFRFVKWTGAVCGIVCFNDLGWFWWTLAGLALAGTLMHCFYRWKTNAWTRAWGGWNDLNASRE